ncbi:HK97 gp10 family phage protein [Bacillus sp. JJ1474]|uniref:HK97 gp10 family phage protein n=1 Tax=Bacillus sp. JJ1474 TaxID=3122955 RepID=UPI002FFD5EF7
MSKFKIEGMKELQKSIKKLGEVPQKVVTPAARKGMNVALKAAKKGGWVDQTGQMRKGMKLVGERSKHKGKKVYQVVFDRAKNDVFQKKNAEGEVTGYYPASQEYGFYTKDGRYIPGFHFLENSLEENSGTIEKTIVDEMSKQIDKVLEG